MMHFAKTNKSEQLRLAAKDAVNNSESQQKFVSEASDAMNEVAALYHRAAQMCHDACKQRDMWKAAHDNQVELRRTLMDRPDLQDRAASMQKLIEKLSTALRERDEARKERDDALAAGGFCTVHAPSGGHRRCLVCSCEKLSAAISRIDYACGTFNEMGVSDYDLHADESQVVLRVRKLVEERDTLRNALEKIKDYNEPMKSLETPPMVMVASYHEAEDALKHAEEARYTVMADHPILARPDRKGMDFAEATAYAKQLKESGFENVTVANDMDKPAKDTAETHNVKEYRWNPDSGYPVLRGFVSCNRDKLEVFCPYCDCTHVHGWSPDNPSWAVEHRAAHCQKGPLLKNGYYIGEMAVRASNTAEGL